MRYPYPFRLIAFTVLLCAIAVSVRAQEPVAPGCITPFAKRDDVLGMLNGKFGEVIERRGFRNDMAVNGTMAEVTSNPETGSWTVINTTPDGNTCIVAAGEAWEPVDQQPSGEPS